MSAPHGEDVDRGPPGRPSVRMRPVALLLLAAALAAGCGGEDRGDEGTGSRLDRLFRIGGLDRPESVAWDARRERWLVTNVAEAEEGAGTGFVTAVSARGDTVCRRCYDASMPGLRLDAPRGIAVRGDTAWIADARRVVALDLAGDSALFQLRLRGAELLNDVAVAKRGPVFVSDTRAGVVWRVRPDGSDYGKLGAAGSLRGPNGLLVEPTAGDGKALLVAGWDGAVLALNPDSSVTLLAEAPGFQHLDGLQPAPDGGLLVGDYGTGRLHHLQRRSPDVWRAGEPWLTDLTAPADFLVRDTLLALPELEADRMTVYRIRNR